MLRTPAFNTEKRSVGGLTEGDLAGRGSGGLAPYRGPVEAVAALEPSSSGASARTSARPAATIGSTTSHSPVELRATPSPREPDPLDRRFLQGSSAKAGAPGPWDGRGGVEEALVAGGVGCGCYG